MKTTFTKALAEIGADDQLEESYKEVVMSKFIDSRLIGLAIKNLRLSKNWTQDYLADVIGYSVRNLRRIENDGTSNLDVINTFADVFDVSALDILRGCFLFYLIKTLSNLPRDIVIIFRNS